MTRGRSGANGGGDDRPERLSPGCEAYWSRRSEREWVATYGSRKLVVARASPRSPMLTAYIDGIKVFGRVRFLPLAQQRCEALVRLGGVAR
jgi:diadenosine tetraphosphatase ApaH/serine/threonine PP2A family protein phosphatase